MVWAIMLVPKSAAQNNLKGTLRCTRRDSQLASIGSEPFHYFRLEEHECAWVKSFQLGTSLAKEETRVAFIEINGRVYRERGSSEGTMANGEKYSIRWWFELCRSNDKYSSARQIRGRWIFTGGTGKLESIRGGGNYTGEVEDGVTSLTVEGKYWLPE
jgi:hypothetical protein